MANIARPNVPDNAVLQSNVLPDGGTPIGCVIPIVLPTVITVTVAVEGEVPLSFIELGDTEQVEGAGAPLQLSATV